MAIEVTLPELGEGIDSADVLNVLVAAVVSDRAEGALAYPPRTRPNGPGPGIERGVAIARGVDGVAVLHVQEQRSGRKRLCTETGYAM